MKSEKLLDAIGKIDDNLIYNAVHDTPKKKKGSWFKWGAIAACLCLMIPLTAFAIDTIQYNAAVNYLNSLGIPVEDLSDYSRKEIKEAAKTIDAGESSPLTEEILNLSPDNEKPIDTPTQVTSEQIRELTPTMTREEVLSFLGDTQDIGSGIYIYVYEVDQQYLLRIPFATVYKGNIIKNLIMDCQSYTKYRPNETTGGIFVSWRRKEELPTGA